MGVLLFHRVMSVSDGKARSRAILVFFGLDSAPPSFRHVGSLKRCSRVRRPSDYIIFGVGGPDFFRKCSAEEG